MGKIPVFLISREDEKNGERISKIYFFIAFSLEQICLSFF